MRIAWPDSGEVQDEYSFVDTLSVPRLRVTNRRAVTFRQLDFGDMVVQDEIEGTSVRPLTGLLADLFRLIGDGSLVYARSAVADDGTQIMRGKAKRLLSVTATVTIYRDGRAEKDIPADRPDLAAIEERLKQELEIEYYPYRCW